MRPTNEPNSERSTLSQRAPLPRHRKMKATWITSSPAGAIFGAVIYALERNGEKTDMAFVSPLFFAVFLIGAIGIAQIREMYAERRKRDPWILQDHGRTGGLHSLLLSRMGQNVRLVCSGSCDFPESESMASLKRGQPVGLRHAAPGSFTAVRRPPDAAEA